MVFNYSIHTNAISNRLTQWGNSLVTKKIETRQIMENCRSVSTHHICVVSNHFVEKVRNSYRIRQFTTFSTLILSVIYNVFLRVCVLSELRKKIFAFLKIKMWEYWS